MYSTPSIHLEEVVMKLLFRAVILVLLLTFVNVFGFIGLPLIGWTPQSSIFGSGHLILFRFFLIVVGVLYVVFSRDGRWGDVGLMGVILLFMYIPTFYSYTRALGLKLAWPLEYILFDIFAIYGVYKFLGNWFSSFSRV